MTAPAPLIAIGPVSAPFVVDAVEQGGGRVVELADADALVWMNPGDADGLRAAIAARPGLRWVQLPLAGIEKVVEAGILDHDRLWTSAKGSYAEPVAEHALALALAGLRHLPERITATSWGTPAGTSLYDRDVVILGAGGIAVTLLELLAPFRTRATVVRRSDTAVPGARATVGPDRLLEVIPGALVVFVAAALTPATIGIIAAKELAAMDDGSWLVNVGRGRHVDTDALVAALSDRPIGAALDVTDPEPLPDGHPLWTLPNCIITPHTADTIEMVIPLLSERIRTNVARFGAGESLVGVVDTHAGY